MDFLKDIVEFNSDKEIIALRERFNKASFFEIISKERSETTYSSFLKWLFQEHSVNNETCSPVAMLLDILVRRSEEQKDYTDDVPLKKEDIKKNIVTRNFKILSVKAETEKAVGVLAQNIISNGYSGYVNTDNLKKIAANSRDRIDLFVDCEIELEFEDVSVKHLQIIIENKIDSAEGGEKTKNANQDNDETKKRKKNLTGFERYDNATQTERYFIGSKITSSSSSNLNKDDIIQIFVYLSPLSSQELSNFKYLKELQDKYDKETKIKKNRKRIICADRHFVQINYQDIVDGILMPMLASSSLSSRSRFFLEEFLNQLVFPNLDGAIMHPSIAIGKDYSEELSRLWDKYKPLIIHSAIVASESDFWTIDDTYYDHQPREELLKILLSKGVSSDIIKDGKWEKGARFKTMQGLAKTVEVCVNQVEIDIDDRMNDLLTSFWDKNKRLLTAWLNGLKEKDREKAKGLLSQVSKRDTTKYYVYYNDILKNKDGKASGKGETAFLIVKLWVEEQKSHGLTVSIKNLVDKFPRSINNYYDKSKAFKTLFYQWTPGQFKYNGENGNNEEVKGNWDFDMKGRFNIELSDKETVTMLKMWRKDALETLIKHIEKRKLFKGTIKVIPT